MKRIYYWYYFKYKKKLIQSEPVDSHLSKSCHFEVIIFSFARCAFFSQQQCCSLYVTHTRTIHAWKMNTRENRISKNIAALRMRQIETVQLQIFSSFIIGIQAIGTKILRFLILKFIGSSKKSRKKSKKLSVYCTHSADSRYCNCEVVN